MKSSWRTWLEAVLMKMARNCGMLRRGMNATLRQVLSSAASRISQIFFAKKKRRRSDLHRRNDWYYHKCGFDYLDARICLSVYFDSALASGSWPAKASWCDSAGMPAQMPTPADNVVFYNGTINNNFFAISPVVSNVAGSINSLSVDKTNLSVTLNAGGGLGNNFAITGANANSKSLEVDSGTLTVNTNQTFSVAQQVQVGTQGAFPTVFIVNGYPGSGAATFNTSAATTIGQTNPPPSVYQYASMQLTDTMWTGTGPVNVTGTHTVESRLFTDALTTISPTSMSRTIPMSRATARSATSRSPAASFRREISPIAAASATRRPSGQ